MFLDNVVQYRIPEHTEIKFVISPQERELLFKLLEGTAKIQIGSLSFRLPLGQEHELSLWKCLNPHIKSRTGCDIIVRGNHYVYRAVTKIGETSKNLFGVSVRDNSLVFVLEKGIQLHIFSSESASELDVSLECTRGAPEVFGYLLVPKRKYPLSPCSSVVVNSRDNKLCTVSIHGDKRRIKVSLLEERTWTRMRSVHARIHALRLQAMEEEYVGPAILVIGPTNVGKTSCCHYLLNRALENRMRPVYIDLDVCCNSNTIPGAISLIEIDGRHPLGAGFMKHDENILQFGNMTFDNNNIQLYCCLIRKMSELLSINQSYSRRHYSGAIIDTSGSLGQNISAIDCILQSFPIDLVVVIGDKSYYDTMKNSILKTKESEFIPRAQNIEPQDGNRKRKLLENTLRKYFYGRIDKPVSPNYFEAKFSDFVICRIVNKAPGRKATDTTISDFSFVPVVCEPSIEYYILGVSLFTGIDITTLAEIKYFVCFTKVDIEKETVTVLSPVIEHFREKTLIIGNIKMLKN